jgi:hypothetical protein
MEEEILEVRGRTARHKGNRESEIDIRYSIFDIRERVMDHG